MTIQPTAQRADAAAETSIFERYVEASDEWRRAAAARGWPDGLLARALKLRTDQGTIEFWLTHEQDHPDVRDIERWLGWREQLISGTMRVREATWQDDSALCDLYANSPEDIGDWEVTVERSPYPYAQFRLQEHVNIQLLEDRGVALAVAAHSIRNTIIGGQRTTAHIATAWRTRKECRGMGYSNLLRSVGGPACSWFGMVNYWYFRSGNFGAFNWVKALNADMLASAPPRDGDVPGIPVTVFHLPAGPFTGDHRAIRRLGRGDVPACLRLINRTHGGLDLFRPYSQEFFEMRLDDPHWDPKPPFWRHVYGWEDYYVLERDGRIIACAGLWDRGQHIREVWRHKGTGESHVADGAALMDFGYARGCEAEMAQLIGHLLGATAGLGRSDLIAPVEQMPKLARALAPYEPVEETRSLLYSTFDEGGVTFDAKITRPDTDLAYW